MPRSFKPQAVALIGLLESSRRAAAGLLGGFCRVLFLNGLFKASALYSDFLDLEVPREKPKNPKKLP